MKRIIKKSDSEIIKKSLNYKTNADNSELRKILLKDSFLIRIGIKKRIITSFYTYNNPFSMQVFISLPTKPSKTDSTIP